MLSAGEDECLLQFSPEELLLSVGIECQCHQAVPDAVFTAVHPELALHTDEGSDDGGCDTVLSLCFFEPLLVALHELSSQCDTFGDEDLGFVAVPAEVCGTYLVSATVSGECFGLVLGFLEQSIEVAFVKFVFFMHFVDEGFCLGVATVVYTPKEKVGKEKKEYCFFHRNPDEMLGMGL